MMHELLIILFGMVLPPIIFTTNFNHPSSIQVRCRNYGKALGGLLDDCDPKNFHCFLGNPIVVNLTEIVCVDKETTGKGQLCMVTRIVPLMDGDCLNEEDCHIVVVSCPISKAANIDDIITDNAAHEQELNIIIEQALTPPSLVSEGHTESEKCFSFRKNNSLKTNDVIASPKSCLPVDAVCQTVNISPSGKSTVVCTVQHSGKLHKCSLIWETNKQDCDYSHCSNLHLNCPVLEEYKMAMPSGKSTLGFLGLMLSLTFIAGVSAACIISCIKQICMKNSKIADIKNNDDT